MANVVHVKDISKQTSEKEVRDFFSFCGKINYLTLSLPEDGSSDTQSATVAFEKETAAKTALLLDNTQLGPNHVHVSAASGIEDTTGVKAAPGIDEKEGEVAQEDKPRSRIFAEYLAHGYVISDKAIESAINLDQQHGISTRFTTALQNFDSKYNATGKAQELDAKFGVSQTAAAGWAGLNSYFEKALETPSGQKLRAFYDQGNKQVMDVHTEARHLADLKSGKTTSGKSSCVCGGTNSSCNCDQGKCACSDCPNQSSRAAAVKESLTTVPGTDKTSCSCGGETGVCACAPGKCTCASCNKNAEATA